MTIHIRGLTPRISTANQEERTVEAIVSTGAPVQRPGFIEQLDLSLVDLSTLIGGPVLDGHRSGSTRDQLGVVEAAEVRSEGLWVRIRFRSNDAAKSVLTDIADGTLRGLSVGYTVKRWKDETRGSARVRTAIDWRPVEVSIVPVPADAGAHFRNGDNGDTQMPKHQENNNVNEAPLVEHVQRNGYTEVRLTDRAMNNPDLLRRSLVNQEIRTIAATAGLTRDWADGQIDANATADAAREAAFAEMVARGERNNVRTTRADITMDHNDPQVIATRAGEALFARSHPEHQLSDAARQFAYLTFTDHAREALRRSGITSSGLSGDTIITRALHTTSDFPLILGDAVNRELRRAYDAAPSGARHWPARPPIAISGLSAS